jgi:hypothetical protein
LFFSGLEEEAVGMSARVGSRGGVENQHLVLVLHVEEALGWFG